MPNYFDEPNTFNSFDNNQSPLNTLQQLCYSCAEMIDDYCKSDISDVDLEYFEDLPLTPHSGNLLAVNKNAKQLFETLQAFGNKDESILLFHRFKELSNIISMIVNYDKILMTLINKLEKQLNLNPELFYKLLKKLYDIRDHGFEEYYYSLNDKAFRNFHNYTFSIDERPVSAEEYIVNTFYTTVSSTISKHQGYQQINELPIEEIIDGVNKIIMIENLGGNNFELIKPMLYILNIKKKQVRALGKDSKDTLSLLSTKISLLKSMPHETEYAKTMRTINTLQNKIHSRGNHKLDINIARKFSEAIMELRNYENIRAMIDLEQLKETFRKIVEDRINHLLHHGVRTEQKIALAEEFKSLIRYF